MTNPFEAPSHGPSGTSSGPGVAGDLDIFKAYTLGWEAVQRNFIVWFGALVAAFVAIFVAEMLCVLPVLVVGPAVMWGLMRFHLEAIEGEARFETVFSGFERIGDVVPPILLAGIATAAIVIAIEIPFGIVFGVLGAIDSEVLSLVVGVPAFLALMAVILTVSMRLSLWIFLIADRNMGAIDSLSESWRLTDGRTLQLLGFALMAIPISFLGALACGVGMIPAAMVIYGAQASVYRQLSGGLRA